jgi:hypothetical protein
MTYTMMDGVALHKANPTSFEIPSADDIAKLKAGDYIKIGVKFNPNVKIGDDPAIRVAWEAKVGHNLTDGERFWVKLTSDPLRELDDPVFKLCVRGVIDNDLVYTAHHGLDSGQTITVERRHILAIL